MIDSVLECSNTFFEIRFRIATVSSNSVPLSSIVTNAHCTLGVHRCPGTSYLLQWWIRGKWIIAVQALQISRIIRQILQGNESSSILEFKFDYGIQIGKSNEADFTFRFDLIFHSWSFSSCFHVMLLSQLICYVIILPKSACRCIVPTQ